MWMSLLFGKTCQAMNKFGSAVGSWSQHITLHHAVMARDPLVVLKGPIDLKEATTKLARNGWMGGWVDEWQTNTAVDRRGKGENSQEQQILQWDSYCWVYLTQLPSLVQVDCTKILILSPAVIAQRIPWAVCPLDGTRKQANDTCWKSLRSTTDMVCWVSIPWCGTLHQNNPLDVIWKKVLSTGATTDRVDNKRMRIKNSICIGRWWWKN